MLLTPNAAAMETNQTAVEYVNALRFGGRNAGEPDSSDLQI